MEKNEQDNLKVNFAWLRIIKANLIEIVRINFVNSLQQLDFNKFCGKILLQSIVFIINAITCHAHCDNLRQMKKIVNLVYV